MIAECGMNLCGENSNNKRLKKTELSRQVKISLVAHFDPFQASDITADKNIFTMQFLHRNAKGRDGGTGVNWLKNLGWLANQVVNGVDYFNEDEQKSKHGINTLFSNISNLQEGSYKWNGSNWDCINCK
jgi:hypothetical protein